MKKQVLHIIILMFVSIGFYSCKDPIPTELTPDDLNIDDDLQIEILSPNPDEFVYANGYDSTGVTQPVPPRSAMIAVNDIKTTIGSSTFESANFRAVFFDKTQPIVNRQGRTVGFKTRLLGKTFFDGDSANLIPMIFRYKDEGIIKDTLAGLQHNLRKHKRRVRHHNRHVNFKIKLFFGNQLQFNIVTPPEVTGNVNTSGKAGDQNFKMELTWDAANAGPMEIIIGGVLKSTGESYPLYNIKTRDDGKLRVPNSLLKNIPYDQFTDLVITFIRRFRTEIGNNEINDNFVTANNIHNIRMPVN